MADCPTPQVWDIPGIGGYLQCIAGNIVTALQTDISNVGTTVTGIASSVGNSLSTDVQGVGSSVSSTAASILAQINNSITAIEGSVSSAKTAITDYVQNQLGTDIGNVIQAVRDKAAALEQDIVSNVDAALTAIQTTADSIKGKLQDAATGILTSIQNAAQGITAQIAQQIDALTTSFQTLLGSLVKTLSDSINTLLSNLATVDDVTGAIIAAVKSRSPELAAYLIATGGTALGHGLLALLDTLEGETPAATMKIADHVASLPGIPSSVRELLGEIRPGTHPTNVFLLTAFSILSFVPFIGGAFEPGKVAITQGVWQDTPIKVPGVGEVVQAYRRQVIGADLFHSWAAMNGFGEETADVLFRASATLIPPGNLVSLVHRGEISEADYQAAMVRQGFSAPDAISLLSASVTLENDAAIRDAFLRGMISEGQHDTALASLGYADSAIALRKRLYLFVPGASDLTRMADKHVWSGDIGQKYGQFAEMPEQYAQFMAQVGYSPDWTKLYWASHWNLPSPQQIFTMRHRGAITDADMNAYLALTDWLPFFRDGLLKISYNPISRIDIRRLFANGLLSDNELVVAYQNIGYTVADAEKLAALTKILAQGAKHTTVEPFRAGMKTHALTAYGAMLIDKATAEKVLAALGYDAGQVAGFIAEGDFIREAKKRTAAVADIKRLFVRHLVDDGAARDRLAKYGIGPAEREALLAEWDLDAEYRDLTAGEKAARELTKGEVLQAYGDKLLSKEEASKALAQLRYHPREILILLELEDLKTARATATARRNLVHARYTRGLIDRQTASNQLDALGLGHEHRDALLDSWEVARIHAVLPVPVADIKHLAKLGALSYARVVELMKAHTYPADVVAALLADWGIKP